jgi:hypothetical protein
MSDLIDRLEAEGAITVVRMEPLFAHTHYCCICDAEVEIPFWSPSYGIAMYEGMPVPIEWEGEWGGFCACKECFDKNERGELPRWTIEQLRIVTTPAAAPERDGGL